MYAVYAGHTPAKLFLIRGSISQCGCPHRLWLFVWGKKRSPYKTYGAFRPRSRISVISRDTLTYCITLSYLDRERVEIRLTRSLQLTLVSYPTIQLSRGEFGERKQKYEQKRYRYSINRDAKKVPTLYTHHQSQFGKYRYMAFRL